jgi:hypothetical protein
LGAAREARARGRVRRPPREHVDLTIPAPLAAPDDLPVLAESYRPGAVPTAWRRAAEQAIEEAQRLAERTESSSFQGWFG